MYLLICLLVGVTRPERQRDPSSPAREQNPLLYIMFIIGNWGRRSRSGSIGGSRTEPGTGEADAPDRTDRGTERRIQRARRRSPAVGRGSRGPGELRDVLAVHRAPRRSGFDVVVEGTAARITSPAQLQRLAAMWKSK